MKYMKHPVIQNSVACMIRKLVFRNYDEAYRYALSFSLQSVNVGRMNKTLIQFNDLSELLFDHGYESFIEVSQ